MLAMRLLACLVLAAVLAAAWVATAQAGSGSLAYAARVVHNNRSQLSYVDGRIDLASGDYDERVERSYNLNWRELPGQMLPTTPALPSVWGVGGRTAQRYGTAQQTGGNLPRFDSPLLRHFIVGQVLADVEALQPQQTFLSGQLVIQSVDVQDGSFEVVASFRGAALVAVGRRADVDGKKLVRDVAVLGPEGELYQYFIDEMHWSADPPAQPIALPPFNAADYVTFPAGEAQPVPIRPVKDWLVFQATLPDGRPLNLVFDSGAEKMIIDDWVLKLDAGLKPHGDLAVSGALESGQMQQYDGFAFNIGGVQFKNLSVVGTQLTSLGIGANMRIHGIVGNEILQLCRIDFDLESGEMRLSQPGNDTAPGGEQLALTFIKELPHVEAQVADGSTALMLLDTGQRAPLSVNLDWLDSEKLGDKLKMSGFLGDITGGLAPRYIMEDLDLSLGGQTYHEKAVDAAMDYTFQYDGIPVVGSIGFSLLARHFGGITFDYSHKLLYLRDPAENHEFFGQPEAWAKAGPAAEGAGAESVASAAAETTPAQQVAAAVVPPLDPRRPVLLRDHDASSDDPRASYQLDAAGDSAADPLQLVRASPPEGGDDESSSSSRLSEFGLFWPAQELAAVEPPAAEVAAMAQPAANTDVAAVQPAEVEQPAPMVAVATPQPAAPGSQPSLYSMPQGITAELKSRLEVLAGKLRKAIMRSLRAI